MGEQDDWSDRDQQEEDPRDDVGAVLAQDCADARLPLVCCGARGSSGSGDRGSGSIPTPLDQTDRCRSS